MTRAGRPGRLLTLALTVALGVGMSAGTATGAPAAPVAPASAGAPVDRGVADDGIGDAYFPLDGNAGIDVRHYDIANRYWFGSRRLAGRTRVTLRTTTRLRGFHLDLLLPVRSVKIPGHRVTWSKPNRHELRVRLARTVPKGTPLTVVVRYAGRPGRIAYLGERNWLASDREVVTINQPHMAPWWFPANDHPRDRATMSLHITVPRGRTVVANGLPRGRTQGKGLTTWHWSSRQPMATYAAFFAAGDFKVERGVDNGLPWLVGVSKRLSASAQNQSLTMLKRSPAIVGWLSGQLGGYPFGSTGGLVTSLQPGFALETQTRPVYPQLNESSTWLLVHELAHQWLGDHVRLRSWRDIWLNEGMATFMEVRYAETHGGSSARQWLRGRYDSYGASDPFWDLRIGDPGPGQLFAPPVYVRGAMTMQALRQRIGGGDFRRLLRAWTRRHGGRAVTSRTFEKLAEKVSGKNLTSFFDAWLRSDVKPANTRANGLGH